jgi:hypothetical protein
VREGERVRRRCFEERASRSSGDRRGLFTAWSSLRRCGRHVAVAGLAGLVLVAAGCGESRTPSVASLPTTTSHTSSSARSTSTTGGTAPVEDNFVAFANCMNSHGVPTRAGRGGGLLIGTPADQNASTFQAAQKACHALLPKGGQTRPLVPEAQEHAMLAFAACMRRHGFPDYADPGFPPGGGIFGGGLPDGDPAGKTSAFQQAGAVCSSRTPNVSG